MVDFAFSLLALAMSTRLVATWMVVSVCVLDGSSGLFCCPAGHGRKEIADDERKASQELLKARQEMEAALVADIRGVMEKLASSKSVDLIFDKSFLPKANKAIIFTSDNVTDLTDEIVGILNK